MQTYTCSCCGEEHEGWPAIAFNSPNFYHNSSEEQKENNAEFDEDFCVVTLDGETSWFIRCTMTQKVNDHCNDLDYGVWVSLSEKSFTDYSTNYNNQDHEAMYFGWLNNFLPGYDDESIPTTVHTRKGNSRPDVVPHSDFDHAFVQDYYNGIDAAEAKRRIAHMLGTTID